MTNNKPQVENGYLQLATGAGENDVLMALIKAKLSGTEYQVIMLVIRKTWGYKKKKDWISLSQFSAYTSRKKRGIVDAINRLVQKNILVRKSGKGKRSVYSFNKNFTEWKILVHNSALVQKNASTSAFLCNQLVQKNRIRTTKENNTKETITKYANNKKSKDFSGVKKSPNGINHEFQLQAMELIKALEISPKRKGAYFKAVKDYPRKDILSAYSFAVDHPKKEARDKMFFWKLNNL